MSNFQSQSSINVDVNPKPNPRKRTLTDTPLFDPSKRARHDTQIVKKLSENRYNDTDTTLIIGYHRIPVHSLVIGMHSKTLFRQINKQKKVYNDTLVMNKDRDSKIMGMMIDKMYGIDIKYTDLELAELMFYAKIYGYRDLFESCKSELFSKNVKQFLKIMIEWKKKNETEQDRRMATIRSIQIQGLIQRYDYQSCKMIDLLDCIKDCTLLYNDTFVKNILIKKLETIYHSDYRIGTEITYRELYEKPSCGKITKIVCEKPEPIPNVGPFRNIEQLSHKLHIKREDGSEKIINVNIPDCQYCASC